MVIAKDPAIRAGRVPEAAFLEAKEHFPGRSLAELTLSIIAVNAWNRFSVAFR